MDSRQTKKADLIPGSCSIINFLVLGHFREFYINCKNHILLTLGLDKNSCCDLYFFLLHIYECTYEWSPNGSLEPAELYWIKKKKREKEGGREGRREGGRERGRKKKEERKERMEGREGRREEKKKENKHSGFWLDLIVKVITQLQKSQKTAGISWGWPFQSQQITKRHGHSYLPPL